MRQIGRIGRKVLFKVSQNISEHILVRAFPFRDGVRAARVHAHVKLFAKRNEFVDQQFESLEMHVVIAGALYHDQIAALAGSKIDWSDLLVRVWAIMMYTILTLFIVTVIGLLIMY